MTDNYLSLVRDIILKHVDCNSFTVFLYGSRADGTSSHSSDIDVGVLGTKPLQDRIRRIILEELEDSKVPFHVEVVDFLSVDKGFMEQATKNIVLWNKAIPLN